MTTSIESWPIAWPGGEARLLSVGGMLADCCFVLPSGRRVAPFAPCPWAGEDSAEMRALTAVLTDAWAAVGDGPGHTFPALRPIARIDHVLVSADVRPEAAAVVAARASDHRPLVVDVDLPDEAPLFA